MNLLINKSHYKFLNTERSLEFLTNFLKNSCYFVLISWCVNLPKQKESLIKMRNKIAKKHVYRFYDSITKVLLTTNIPEKWLEREGKIIRNFNKWFGLKWEKRIKFFYCPRCKNIMLPNIRVRIRNNRFRHITLTCPKCGNFKRIRISK